MTSTHPALHDVIIIGAGPVGLFLACELRLADLAILVIEQAADPASPLKRLPFGLRGLSAPTIEAFDRRGLLDAIAARQASAPGGGAAGVPHWMRQARRPGGHFAGLQFFLDKVDVSQWPYRLPGPVGTSLAIDMQSLETVLAERAAALGVEIRRGLRVETLAATDEDVTVRAGGEAFRGRWLVGCDGGRSAVRKAGGFAFAGTEPEFTGYSVEVEIGDPGALSAGRTYTATGMYTYQPPGTVAMVDFDGGACHRAGSIGLDHVQSVLRRISGTDVTLTALKLFTTWTDHAFQATAYRKGRILLAGDAAHIHSPLGGQGLNLGLGDAMNLGWKLAAMVRGDAPADLLDSYQRERHPIGARILDWSRAQVALMRPTPGTRALAAIVGDLIDTGDGATYFAEHVWGVSLRQGPGGSHPLVGRSVPDIVLADGCRAGALLRRGTGLLLDFDSRPTRRALTEGRTGRIAYLAGDCAARLGLSALLVRPDGVVAWASDFAADDEGADRAASQWFGDAVSG